MKLYDTAEYSHNDVNMHPRRLALLWGRALWRMEAKEGKLLSFLLGMVERHFENIKPYLSPPSIHIFSVFVKSPDFPNFQRVSCVFIAFSQKSVHNAQQLYAIILITII